MKKSFAIIALAALVMLAGCKKNDPKPNGTRLIAGIEKHKSDSKTSLDGLQIKWTAGDKLYVYDKDAEEGAIFTLSSGEGTSTGEFTGTYNFTNENVAVYPSSSFSGSGGTIVTMTLPAVQTASGSGTFGNGANPMLGVFSDFNNLTLKSLCGVLCLQLTGNAAISAIEIVGGPDDKLNGTFTANYKDTDPVLAKSGDDGTNTVRLNCNATLTSMAQKFYVVLPAGTLANGFTMKVYNGTNVIFTKSTTHDITMHLNTIETMDPLHIELWDGNLSTLTGSEPAGYATATNDMTIYGTLAATANNVKVSIADGANVTLQDATINGQGFSSYNYAGLTLLGSANITLVGTSTMSGGVEKAGIYAPVGGTLTISGDGTINATGGEYAAGIGSNYLGSSGDIVITNGSATINATGGYAGAGIGSGYKAASECGNIEITDSFTGTVNATGHYGSPGIGSGNRSSCGSITISGGTINATGEDGGAVGNGAPGIGSGIDGSCGAITINESVTLVTAVKGNSAPCCIGKGSSATCGTITIGTINYGTSGVTSNWPGGLTFVYPFPAGAINSIFNVGTSASPKYVYFSEGNLQYSQSADKWSFMEHQYDMVETSGMNVGTNYADQDIVSLFGWGTGNNPTKTGGGAAEYENYTEWGTNTIYSGTTATTNWRTLTRDEWDNLFANHQYGYVMISNGSQWICGVAIDPSSTTTLNTDHSHWSNNIYWTGLDAFIADAEAGGWLFLPAAGLRTGTSVANVSDPVSGAGYYWSSTKEYDSLLECYQSNYLLIKSNDDAMINRNLGFIGHSVRLVKDAE